jgi:hypothetical protein
VFGPGRILALIVILAAAGLAAGCAPERARPMPADAAYTIPAGTARAQSDGRPSFTLPESIDLLVGQSITVRNDDQAMHYFFDVPIAPGQTYRRTFGQPGQFVTVGGMSCSIVAEKQRVVVTVRGR